MLTEKEINILTALIDSELETIEKLGLREENDILRKYAGTLRRIEKKLRNMKRFYSDYLVISQTGVKMFFKE
ncbi:MAG: hypothetical protein ABH883_00465 [Candidatus Omnitrophota bacterium]